MTNRCTIDRKSNPTTCLSRQPAKQRTRGSPTELVWAAPPYGAGGKASRKIHQPDRAMGLVTVHFFLCTIIGRQEVCHASRCCFQNVTPRCHSLRMGWGNYWVHCCDSLWSTRVFFFLVVTWQCSGNQHTEYIFHCLTQ